MKNDQRKNNILGFMMLIVAIAIPSLSQAQVSSSTGRSNVITENMNQNDIKAIRKIRKYINEQKFDKAINRAKRIIKAEARRSRAGSSYSEFYKEAYNCVCVGLTGLGKTDEAMEACNTSLELTPNHWESFKTRATLHYMTQDFQKSLDDFTMALQNAPKDTGITDVLKQNIDVVKSKIN